MARNKKKKSGFKPFVIILVILAVITGAGLFGYQYLLTNYTINTVVVEGSSHYTDNEIKNMVMDGKYGNNSIYLAYKYKNREITDIPFIETINVLIVDKDTVRITVYEKALAGYIEYLGRYIYFDKDGIVVESSTVKTKGVPEVVGVNFDYVVLYEALPAKDKDLFRRVLNITQLMNKYGVDAGKMYFDGNGNITLYKDSITIKLGSDENLDIKIMNLPSILTNLEGKKGILEMSNYDEGTKRVTFENDGE